MGLIAPSTVKRQNKGGENNDGNSDSEADDDEDLFNMEAVPEKKEEESTVKSVSIEESLQ